jgi:hypothetical protein
MNANHGWMSGWTGGGGMWLGSLIGLLVVVGLVLVVMKLIKK